MHNCVSLLCINLIFKSIFSKGCNGDGMKICYSCNGTKYTNLVTPQGQTERILCTTCSGLCFVSFIS